MTTKRLPVIMVLCLPLGCAPSAETAEYEPVADVPQLMNAILEPAAETYWDAVGWILDSDGTHAIAPASPEEWEAVRNAAFVIAESGNLLLMEPRAPDRAAWAAMSRALIAAGRSAIAAAEAQNPDTVFVVGGVVYEACTACHAAYALETLRPSDARR